MIATDGSTSLAEVGNDYFLYGAGTTTGPELEYGGSAGCGGPDWWLDADRRGEP